MRAKEGRETDSDRNVTILIGKGCHGWKKVYEARKDFGDEPDEGKA